MLKDVEDSKRINNTIRSEWNTNEQQQQQQQQQSQTVDENKVSYTINHAYHIYVSIPPLTLIIFCISILMYQLKYLV
jgi:hypothetical protein